MVAQIEGEQIMFLRKLDDHKQVVHCWVEDGGLLSRVDAFVADVAEGANANELNMELWRMMAQFKVKGGDPDGVIAFLESPRQGGRTARHDLEYALFMLPVASNGSHKEMTVVPADPKKKKLGASK